LVLYRRLFGYLKNYLRIFALAVLGMVVVAATGPIFAWLLKPLINEGFVDKNMQKMVWLPLAVVGLFLVRGVFNFFNDYCTTYLSGSLVDRIRREMFAKMMRLPSSYYSGNAGGRLVSRVLNDAGQITEAGFNVITVIAKDGVSVVGGGERAAEWLDSARVLIGNYFRMENPSFLEPAARESFVNARLPSGLAIRGIIDRVDRAPDGALRIVDYKTGKSPNPRFQEEALFQMRFYAAAVRLSRGVLPRRTQLIYLKDGRTLTYDPVPGDVAAIASELDSTWSAIEERLDSRRFEPRPSKLCDWCRFKELCPEFGGVAPDMDASGARALRTAKEPAGPS